ncbi:CPCC family cysteine-rich protein [Streptomyces sp. A1277]|uniref:CPCC family cysteine-rich protein n=1 Tax=Streptomyces sp. A1277 TaxID=2563103 RepID=UPI001F0D62FF|nr:CPCC family cysteine-rich protein [Streptomyces sp. A1277]
MPGSYALCPVCFLEDDGVQFRWQTMGGGADEVSLIEAQRSFQDFGPTRRPFRHSSPLPPRPPWAEGSRRPTRLVIPSLPQKERRPVQVCRERHDLLEELAGRKRGSTSVRGFPREARSATPTSPPTCRSTTRPTRRSRCSRTR